MSPVLHLYNVLGASTERAWLDYTLALASKGWRVSIAYETRSPACPSVPVPHARVPRVVVEPTRDPGGQMDEIAARPSPIPSGVDPDVPFGLVHGHGGTRVLHAAPWLARGVPAVISLYGYDASRLLRDPAWPGRYRWAAAHGATFVVLCDAMRRTLLDAGVPAESCVELPVGIPLDRWPYAPAAGPATPRFVFVGRLTEKKAPGDAVAALAALRRASMPDAELDLIGDGPLADQVRERVEAFRLGGSARLHGTLPRERVRERVASATALVLPSVIAADGDAEGTPVVLMEAAALGVPCVTTRHMGNPEVLPPEGHRFVVPEHDVEGLAAAMRGVAALSPADRRSLQDAGRRWIEQRFDLRLVAEGYDALYRELFGRS